MGTRVELRSVADDERGWHVELARRLTATGAEVRIRPADARGRHGPDGFRALLLTERVLHRPQRPLAARCPRQSLAAWVAGDEAPVPDVVVDLEGVLDRPYAWRVTFDGRPGTAGALAALAAGGFPVVRVTAGERTLAAGRPGSETPRPLSLALEDVLAGAVLLVEQALSGNRLTVEDVDRGGPGRARERAGGAGRAAPLRAVAEAAARSAYRAAYRAPHWKVGWRWLGEGAPDLFELGDHPAEGWSRLPDDGRHFYADPFPVAVGADHFLFVEDFEHRLGRGVISVVEMTADGPAATPRPVLGHRVHLSYPYVFEDAGDWWMIPETCAAGTVELYRAAAFPDRWTREAVLLRDIEASDVSVVHHAGRWWMFGTVRHGGSWSDALHLWSADRLAGPWRAHSRNPVLVDIAGARPAGRPVLRDGRLLRPVQDGRSGYGGALGLAEVVQLDDACYRQRVVARLHPGPRWPGTRLHTLNRAGRLETVDGSARSPRWR